MPRQPSGCFSSWLDHQLREVRSHSKSRLPVHWDAVQHSTFHKWRPTEGASKGPVSSSALDDQSEHHGQRFEQTSQHADVHGFAGLARTAPSSFQSNSGPPQHGARGPGTGPTGFKFHSGSVWQRWHGGHPKQSCKVYPRHQGDGSNSLHRCIQLELGSQFKVHARHGAVVSISKIVSHKRSGDAGRHLLCERLPTSSEVLSGAIDVRQRSDGGVHQERGGAPDRTLWCRWPYDCSSGATARRLHWFPSICQECTTSRRIPCPGSARHWPRSGRWPWRVYDPCLPSGASYGSTCLRHSPTDDSSSSYRRIQTPGRSGQMPCPCLGTTGGTFLYAFPSFKMVPQVLQKIAQSPGVEVILIAQLQPAASWFPELMDLSQEDPIPLFVEGQDLLTQDVWTENVTSYRVETLQAILRAKGHSREAANMMSRCRRESSQQVYESHWSRFVAFCRTKRWQVFRVRSHHFSTYMMHLFRDGLLPSTLISHRTSVASVLRHWV